MVDNSANIPKNFTIKTGEDYASDYLILSELHSKGLGRVFRVKSTKTNEIRLSKHYSKSKILNLKTLIEEIDILFQTDHPNIVKIYDFYEDKTSIYIVKELCQGCDLLSAITRASYTESDAVNYFSQLISAVAYIHEKKLVHRDLKLTNLMFLSDQPASRLMLTDFGIRKHLKGGNRYTRLIGTIDYVSPEVLTGEYDAKADIWSCGVILYFMLFREAPFQGATDRSMLNRITAIDYEIPADRAVMISSEAIALIKKMLADPAYRYTAQDVLTHPWVTSTTEASASQSPLCLDNNMIRSVSNVNIFKKSVMFYIAAGLKDDEINNLKELFKSLDTDDDGILTLAEIKDGIEKLKSTDFHLAEISEYIEKSQTNEIDYTEFISLALEKRESWKMDKLKATFKAFDIDNNGKISKKEMRKILIAEDSDEIGKLLNSFDLDEDGEIDYEEFLSMLC